MKSNIITKDRAIQFLQTWIDTCLAHEKTHEGLRSLFDLAPESPVCDSFTHYVLPWGYQIEEMITGERASDDGPINWFFHENDFGRADFKAGTHTGEWRKIKTAEDLYWMITRPQKS